MEERKEEGSGSRAKASNTEKDESRLRQGSGGNGSSSRKREERKEHERRHEHHRHRTKSSGEQSRRTDGSSSKRSSSHHHRSGERDSRSSTKPQQRKDKERKSEKSEDEPRKMFGYTPEELGEIGAKRVAPLTYRLEDDLFPIDLEFMATVPASPELGPMLLPMPSMLKEACKYKWCSLDHPKYRRFHLEPLMGLDIDLINDDINSNSEPRPLDPADRKLMDLAREVLGDEEVDVIIEHGLKATKILEEMKKNKQKKESAVDESAKLRETAAQGANWLKNTTYLSNNLHESVHSFKSGAEEKARLARSREQETAKEDEPATAYDEAVRSFELANRPLEHATDKSLLVEWSVPIYPDALLWANNYVRVTVDNEPPPAEPPTGRPAYLASQIFTTEKKSRGQKSLSTSLSVPVTSSDNALEYDWARQYHLTIRDDGHAADRLVLFVDNDGRATYVPESSKRVELDHCRIPRAAYSERRSADVKNGYAWTGKTHVKFEDTKTAFDPVDRNLIRAKLRQVNADISDDEELPPSSDPEFQDEADLPGSHDGSQPHEADPASDHAEDQNEPSQNGVADQPAPPLIENEDDDDDDL